MLVKLSDLADNLDQGTLPTITEKDRERFIVYENARLKIMGKLASDYPEIFKYFKRTITEMGAQYVKRRHFTNMVRNIVKLS